MRLSVRVTVLAIAVVLTADGQGWASAVQPSDVPVSETIPSYETLPVETECEVEPRTKEDLFARMDALEESPQPSGTSSGPLTVVESDERGNYRGIPVYPSISIDGTLWIDAGSIVASEAALPRPSASTVEGVTRTLQLLNACGWYLERPFLFGMYTDQGLEQNLRYAVQYGFGMPRLFLGEDPPVNDHEASEPTGTRLYSMVAMSDERVAVVISIIEPPINTSPYEVYPEVFVLKDSGGTWKVDWQLSFSHLPYPYVDPAATPSSASPTPVR